MAWTTPGTAVAGAVLEADFWNSNVRDNTLALYAQSAYPYRNLLYNGAMQVAQRGTSTAGITTTGYYTADRWQLSTIATMIGTWTNSVENDAPTGSGFRKSLKVLCSTANASPTSSGTTRLSMRLEGQDLQRLAKGTSSAEGYAMSFWVKGNATGTYIVELFDVDNNRQVSASYTINASGTWEKKTIILPADLSGAFDNDNNASLVVIFWLAAGSNYTSGSLNTSWAASVDANRVVGQTNLASATNNYWQITGVQLEAGSVATPFEFLPFGDELARCQRYYCKSYNYDTTPGTATTVGMIVVNGTTQSGGVMQVLWPFPVEMRGVPLATFYRYNSTTVGTWDYTRSGAGTTFTPTLGSQTSTRHAVITSPNLGANWVAAEMYGMAAFSAEL